MDDETKQSKDPGDKLSTPSAAGIEGRLSTPSVGSGRELSIGPLTGLSTGLPTWPSTEPSTEPSIGPSTEVEGVRIKPMSERSCGGANANSDRSHVGNDDDDDDDDKQVTDSKENSENSNLRDNKNDAIDKGGTSGENAREEGSTTSPKNCSTTSPPCQSITSPLQSVVVGNPTDEAMTKTMKTTKTMESSQSDAPDNPTVDEMTTTTSLRPREHALNHGYGRSAARLG